MILFRYPPDSAAALLHIVLPVRYCAARFGSRIPTWRLPLRCGVGDLVTEGGAEVGIVGVEQSIEIGTGVRAGAYLLHDGAGVEWAGEPGGSWKRVRLNRKTPAHLASQEFLGSLFRPRVWKRLRVCDQRSGSSC